LQPLEFTFTSNAGVINILRNRKIIDKL